MRVASFFAGIGGFDLGFEQAGMEIVFQCEIDPFCQKVLRKHWPHVEIHDNISTLAPEKIPFADLYCGGFPCQDVSLANQGKRQGLEGERSGLFYRFADLIEQNTPKWVVIENVTGLLSSQHGNDFKVVIQKLDEIGYSVGWRVLDAKYFGTPQRRRRVFIVASYQSLSAVRVLFEPEASQFIVESGDGKKSSLAQGTRNRNKFSNIYSIQHAGLGRKPEAGPQGKGYRNDGETWTLDNRGSADAICKTNAPFRIRKTSGISTGVDRNRYAAIGNAVCVPVVKWIGERILQAEQSSQLS